MKLGSTLALSLFFLILIISIRCQPCENPYEKFQNILRTRQLAGRLPRDSPMQHSRHRVSTKMECLDICFRTKHCRSFDIPKRPKYWLCLINREALQQAITSPKDNTWAHIKVSSQELREVSNDKNKNFAINIIFIMPCYIF